MNITNWVPSLPKNVSYKNEELYDKDLDKHIPLNRTAQKIIEKCDGVKTCGDIFEETKELYDIKEKKYLKDFRKLILFLNAKGLIELKYTYYLKLIAFILNYISMYHPRIYQRKELESNRFLPMFMELTKQVLKPIFIFWLINAAILIAGYLLFQPPNFLVVFSYFTILFFGLILGFALHETLHIYTYRRLVNNGAKGFFLIHVLSIRFVRPFEEPTEKKQLLVTLLGPLIPGLLGASGILLSYFYPVEGHLKNLYVSFFSVFALHLIYLAPIWGDGKSLVKQMLILLFMQRSRKGKIR